MITKENFEAWKELPITREFFKWINSQIITNRLNMFSALLELGKINDLNKAREIYTSNETIFKAIHDVDAGTINQGNMAFDSLIKEYRKELKEVLNVE